MANLIDKHDLKIAFIACFGYWIGFMVPFLLGLSEWRCLFISIVIGVPFDMVVEKYFHDNEPITYNPIKKIFTIDDFMTAFITALGCGFGFFIPNLLGFPEWLSITISFIVGVPVELIASNIIFNKETQRTNYNRFRVFIIIIVIFLVGNLIAGILFNGNLFNEVIEEMQYIIAFFIFGFVYGLAKHFIKVWKIKSKYDKNSKSFIFNETEKDYIIKKNQFNQVIDDKEYIDNLVYLDDIKDDAKGIEDIENINEVAIKLKTGTFVGVKDEGLLNFNGIPYAKAPIGDLRWKSPVSLSESNKVFEAKHFGPSSIQYNFKNNYLKHHYQSEDCLTLNICMSLEDLDNKKPVIVYFHGGDFNSGASVDPLSYGDNFIKNNPGIIFVNFNYRLGLLGFIDFSDIPGGENYPDTLNLGLLDQIAVLNWVKENISSFGGDPEQITVIGDNAGATSIALLSISNKAKGLFNKAILLSDTIGFIESDNKEAKNLANNLLKLANVSNMDELSKLSEEEIFNLTQELKKDLTHPSCDDILIPKDMYKSLDDKVKDIQFIFAFGKDELSIQHADIGEDNIKSFNNHIISEILSKEKSDDSSLKYIKELEEGSEKNKSKFINEWYIDNIIDIVDNLKNRNINGYLLYWDIDSTIEGLGSGSINILSTLYGNIKTAKAHGNIINETASQILQSLSIKFITNQDLSIYNTEIEGFGSLNWKPYPNVLVFKNDDVICVPIEEIDFAND
ncbi:MAG: carboxylesterase family protein [Methanobacteriaceae archaeon]|nr:carboxylesterase family protein [Methanobacteriaceae archaeon]